MLELDVGSLEEPSEPESPESSVFLSRFPLILYCPAQGQGFITKEVLERNLRQAERESGTGPLLDQQRWHELAWDGEISLEVSLCRMLGFHSSGIWVLSRCNGAPIDVVPRSPPMD